MRTLTKVVDDVRYAAAGLAGEPDRQGIHKAVHQCVRHNDARRRGDVVVVEKAVHADPPPTW